MHLERNCWLLAYVVIMLVISCEQIVSNDTTAIKVYTDDAINISQSSAVLAGRVQLSSLPNSSNLVLGFIFSDSSPVTPSDAYWLEAFSITPQGEFSATVSSLQSDITYYYRAAAKVGEKCVYGEERSFITNEDINNGNQGGETNKKVTVETSNYCNIGAISATVRGSVRGVSFATEVGFVYSTNPSPTIDESNSVSTFSVGGFQLTLSGLYDETTYYYRAYAKVDNLYYYGEIASFKTETLTYSIGDKSFKMIHITNTDTKPFAIMQTELPPMTPIVIEGKSFGPIDENLDGCLDRWEMLSFFKALWEGTGIRFRQCSRTEWLTAARGKGEWYTYAGSDALDIVGWYYSNSDNHVHDIALKAPNDYDLYDLSGNYAEIVWDISSDDPGSVEYCSPDGAQYGGSWKDEASKCTVTSYVEGDNSNRNIPGTPYTEYNVEKVDDATIRMAYSL